MGYHIQFMDIFSIILCLLAVSVPIAAEEISVDSHEEEPLIELIEPYPRTEPKNLNRNAFPCANSLKGDPRLEVTLNAHTSVTWYHNRVDKKAKCELRLSSGLDDEDSFLTLKPVDGSSDSEGRFPCTRSGDGLEHKEIAFPDDLSCESCTLQLIWRSGDEVEYYCSDVLIVDDDLDNCMGACRNGGICVRGKCLCPEKYEGQFCGSVHKEKKEETHISKWWIALLFLLLLLAGIILGAIYVKNMMNRAPESNQSLIHKADNRQITSPLKEAPIKDYKGSRGWGKEAVIVEASDPQSFQLGSQNADPDNRPSRTPEEPAPVPQIENAESHFPENQINDAPMGEHNARQNSSRHESKNDSMDSDIAGAFGKDDD